MAWILIVDDEEMVRATLRRQLERAGHDVLEAANGVEAVAIFRERDVDIVVTDIIMPQKEGIETIIEMRRIKPDTRIVAISGSGRVRNLDFLDIAGKVGADVVLAKPFTGAELIEAINKCAAQERAVVD